MSEISNYLKLYKKYKSYTWQSIRFLSVALIAIIILSLLSYFPRISYSPWIFLILFPILILGLLGLSSFYMGKNEIGEKHKRNVKYALIIFLVSSLIYIIFFNFIGIFKLHHIEILWLLDIAWAILWSILVILIFIELLKEKEKIFLIIYPIISIFKFFFITHLYVIDLFFILRLIEMIIILLLLYFVDLKFQKGTFPSKKSHITNIIKSPRPEQVGEYKFRRVQRKGGRLEGGD
jgi:hypothetical protein